MFAIIDCNNFYASCERLFRPDLQGMPIVVLSNNDGCVIARSNEAKALGIKMGQPYFQIKAFCAQEQVQVFSSNYTLYGDLSSRVMQTIEDEWPDVEVYSIDEAFLDLSSMPLQDQQYFAHQVRQRILKEVGIPTSIGIGPSKTLAKAANYLAKKSQSISVLQIDASAYWLTQIPIAEIWGIGRQWAKKLEARQIFNAADLAAQSAPLIRQHFSLPLMQTTLELQGIACHELQKPKQRHSIIASKSFGKTQTELIILEQALSHHCRRATEKLRLSQGKLLSLSVFIRTNPFQSQKPQYVNHCHIHFPLPTDDLRQITSYAKYVLKHIFKPGFHYHKLGVVFEEIVYHTQHSFLEMATNRESEAFMQVLGAIQKKFGRHSIQLAAEGCNTKPWQMKSEQRSPAYTTNWQDIAIVKIR